MTMMKLIQVEKHHGCDGIHIYRCEYPERTTTTRCSIKDVKNQVCHARYRFKVEATIRNSRIVQTRK